jgi:3D (Asp-Asp-Asp) domain-containing protein
MDGMNGTHAPTHTITYYMFHGCKMYSKQQNDMEYVTKNTIYAKLVQHKNIISILHRLFKCYTKLIVQDYESILNIINSLPQ